MKRAKLKIPVNLVDKLAAWLIDNEINVVFSYNMPEEFFAPASIVLIITYPESQQVDVNAWISYLKILN
jgi:hypothetical protein